MSTIGKIKVGGTIYDIAYPIGSIYLSVNETSPAEFFGGTWEQLKDRFLLAAGDTYSAGSTGGEATHTLTIDELASHSHIERMQAGNGKVANCITTENSGTESGVPFKASDWTSNVTVIKTSMAGLSKAHNNMPPYLAVYMWKRVA